ncbi:MAG: chaperone modulator CbpM [Xanthomonadales bacterium]|jgi:chaperone modulatory protein CbpM|nr:chaperone modulator CbpM [Xanthomonadales bacterium]
MSSGRNPGAGPGDRSDTFLVLDRTAVFGIEEVCRACGERRTVVIEMIEHGIIEPSGAGRDSGARPAGDDPHAVLEFHGEALVRAQVAARLMRDLGVNLPGAALAIDLLRQLGRL